MSFVPVAMPAFVTVAVLVIMSMFMIVRVLMPVVVFVTVVMTVAVLVLVTMLIMLMFVSRDRAYVRVCVLRSWLHHPFKRNLIDLRASTSRIAVVSAQRSGRSQVVYLAKLSYKASPLQGKCITISFLGEPGVSLHGSGRESIGET